jgi:hypothetical protein
MVYFDPSPGTSVVSSPAWSLTSFQDVPASSLAPLRFCPTASVRSETVVADAIATAAKVRITRIVFIVITPPAEQRMKDDSEAEVDPRLETKFILHPSSFIPHPSSVT